jgi:hypothetical protein
MIPVNLAVEDALSEAVLRKMLAGCGREYAVGTSYSRGGFGYLKRTIGGFNNAAKGVPFLVLADLDAGTCPADLISAWLPRPKHHNLLFRVAVREVEAWVLGDRNAITSYLGVSDQPIPPDVDAIADPKRLLIDLARMSRRRDIREDLVPSTNSTRQVGPGYNYRMSAFVRDFWSAPRAALHSRSLDRALRAVKTFTPK